MRQNFRQIIHKEVAPTIGDSRQFALLGFLKMGFEDLFPEPTRGFQKLSGGLMQVVRRTGQRMFCAVADDHHLPSVCRQLLQTGSKSWIGLRVGKTGAVNLCPKTLWMNWKRMILRSIPKR